MDKYELKYFEYNGKAGGIRLFLDYLGIKYDDKYYQEDEKIKDSLPFGQPLVLTVNDKLRIGQALAIYRYIGAKYNALAETIEDQAICDSYGEFIMYTYYKLIYEMIKEKTDKKTVQDFAVNKFAPIFNKQLEENGGGFIVGKKLTWLDFLLADSTDGTLERIQPENLEVFERLKAHRDRIFETKNVDGTLRLTETLKKRRDFDKNLKE